MVRFGVLGVCVFGLAACGGSSDPATGPVSGVAAYNEMVDAAIEQDNAFRANTIPITSSFDLPSTGGATYNGPIVVIVQDTDEMVVIGDLTITTNFDPSAELIAGGADNFITNSGERFDGSLDLADGSISDPLGYGTGFTADLDGTLTGDETGDVMVDGQLFGAFGTERDTPGPVAGVLGEVAAKITTDDGVFDANGLFVAD